MTLRFLFLTTLIAFAPSISRSQEISVLGLGASTITYMSPSLRAVVSELGGTYVDKSSVGATSIETMLRIGLHPLKITQGTVIREGTISEIFSEDISPTLRIGEISGSIGTARGVLDSTRSTLLFKREDHGVEFTTQSDDYFLADEIKNNCECRTIHIINTGKNDLNSGANIADVLSRVSTIYNWSKKVSDKSIVIGVFTDNIPQTSSKSTNHVDHFNNGLKEIAGNDFVDLEAYLLSDQVWTDTGLVKSAKDVEAIEKRLLPLTLSRSTDGIPDGRHISKDVNDAFVKNILIKGITIQ